MTAHPSTEEVDNFLSEALATPPEHTSIAADGHGIHVRAWGNSRDETVILIHGIAAHGGWWESVAPFLASSRHVLALDLSGHGDSSRARAYSAESWAADVAPLITANDSPLVIGHSLGGMVALTIARDHGTALRGAIVVDAPLRVLSEQRRGILRSRAATAGTVMDSEAEAIARFRPMPDEGGLNTALVRRVAEQSLASGSDGVRWKVDPAVFLANPLPLEELCPPACPVALVRGESGMLTEGAAVRALAMMPGNLGQTVVPGAGHHPMLSHPLQLAHELHRLIDQWPQSPATADLERQARRQGAS